MNKAERLFQLMSVLRSRRRAITAEQLSEKLGVSVRTIYRDIQALELSGIAIDGEAGIGYMLKPDYEIPPLMFSNDELQSILLGVRMVSAFTDKELGGAAKLAEDKILAVMPDQLKQLADDQPYRIPILDRDDKLRRVHGVLRQACEKKQKIEFAYKDLKDDRTQRTIWPLGMIGWGGVWTLLGWCELRKDYRNFRFDRITYLRTTDDFFETTKVLSLKHYLDSCVGNK